MAEQTYKKYRCTRCGHETEHKTNHWGPTWSVGRYDTCPECPPWAKYPEFGGQTVWECMEKAPLAKAEELEFTARSGEKKFLDREKVNAAFAKLREAFGERMERDIAHGSLYRDYVPFHFGVRELDVEDVYRIRNILGKWFDGMERVTISIQPGREEGNVWVTACHELISTSNNQI